MKALNWSMDICIHLMIDWTSKWDIPAQKEKDRQAAKDKIREVLKPGGGKIGFYWELPSPKVNSKDLSINVLKCL